MDWARLLEEKLSKKAKENMSKGGKGCSNGQTLNVRKEVAEAIEMSELDYSRSTAYNLIKVATEFSNTTSMSDLQSTKIIALLDIPQEYMQELLATNFGRTKNDPAKQVKVASEYVELVGMKHGVNRFNRESESDRLSLQEIAKTLGISTTGLKELLAIDKKLIPTIRELFDKGVINKSTAINVWTRLSPEDQEKFFNEIGRDKISQMTQAQTQKYIDDLKQGRRYLELERIYGIKNGGDRKSDCDSHNLKTQNELAAEHGIAQGGDRKSKGDNLLLKKDVCNSVGITEKQMTEYLRLLKLIPELQDLIDNGNMKPTVGYKVWYKLSKEDQEKLFLEIGKDKIATMTQKEAQKYINKINNLEKQKEKLESDLQKEKNKKPEIKVVEKV